MEQKLPLKGAWPRSHDPF